MPLSTPVRRRGPNGRFISSSTSAAPAITPRQVHTFFILPPEVRCAVYKALFNGTEKHILRRPKARNAPHIALSDNAIIRTCKIVCAEALPIFYSTQKFHYSAHLDEVYLRQQFLLEHTKWVKHLSIDVTVNSQTSTKLDSTVGAHVEMITKYFTTLASFTLHIIPAKETNGTLSDLSQAQASGVFDKGAAAKALRTLHSKILVLRIIMFGNWDDLHPFRSAIASEEKWVQGRKCWGWPGLSLTGAQRAAMLVRQRRYTLAGSEDVIHPHKQCIRVFNLYQPSMKRSSKKKGG